MDIQAPLVDVLMGTFWWFNNHTYWPQHTYANNATGPQPLTKHRWPQTNHRWPFMGSTKTNIRTSSLTVSIHSDQPEASHQTKRATHPWPTTKHFTNQTNISPIPSSTAPPSWSTTTTYGQPTIINHSQQPWWASIQPTNLEPIISQSSSSTNHYPTSTNHSRNFHLAMLPFPQRYRYGAAPQAHLAAQSIGFGHLAQVEELQGQDVPRVSQLGQTVRKQLREVVS